MRTILPILLALSGCPSSEPPPEQTLPPAKTVGGSERGRVGASTTRPDASTLPPSHPPTAQAAPPDVAFLGGEPGVYRQLLVPGVLFEPRKDADGQTLIGGRVSPDGKEIRLDVVVHNRGGAPAARARVTALATIYRANGSTRPLTASAVTRDLPPGERRRLSLKFAYGEPDVPGEPRTLVVDLAKCRVDVE